MKAPLWRLLKLHPGVLAETVDNGRPGNAENLVVKVKWLISHLKELARMRAWRRGGHEAKYTAERNYQMLMEIYQQAIDSHRKGR